MAIWCFFLGFVFLALLALARGWVLAPGEPTTDDREKFNHCDHCDNCDNKFRDKLDLKKHMKLDISVADSGIERLLPDARCQKGEKVEPDIIPTKDGAATRMI